MFKNLDSAGLPLTLRARSLGQKHCDTVSLRMFPVQAMIGLPGWNNSIINQAAAGQPFNICWLEVTLISIQNLTLLTSVSNLSMNLSRHMSTEYFIYPSSTWVKYHSTLQYTQPAQCPYHLENWAFCKYFASSRAIYNRKPKNRKPCLNFKTESSQVSGTW